MAKASSRTSKGTSKRTFQGTHPWLTFELDLRRAPFTLWMDLGAVQSEVEHVAGTLLSPETASRFHTLYLAKGVHATTAIEGNTLSEEEVLQRIENAAQLPDSKAYLGREVDNIVEACNVIAEDVLSGRGQRLSADTILDFNRRVLRDLPLAEGVIPGRFRSHSVAVAGYRGAPAEDCRYLVERLCEWLNTGFEPPAADQQVAFAVLRAVVAHLYLAWIHPFGDGNGRTARLVEFQLLLHGGVPSVAAHLPSNFYNQTRSEYYRQLAAASRSGGDLMPLLSYAVRGLRDALNEQIQVIRNDLRGIVWRDYVHRLVPSESRGDAANRRRLVALALAEADAAVPVAKVRLLTPEIAQLYAGKAAKTLARDLKELAAAELIVAPRQGWVRANLDALSRFLPARRGPS